MTNQVSLTAPGLLTHVFLPAGGENAQAGWERLRTLWHGVIEQLRLSDPVPLLGVPRQLPSQPSKPGSGPRLLASAEGGEQSVWQAYAWADYGVLCVTAMMAPQRERDCARAWADLEEGWRTATEGPVPGDALGEVRILLALLAGDDGLPPDGDAGPTLDLIRAAVPEPAMAGWWRHWDAVPLGPQPGRPDEVLIWEVSADSGDGRRVRRLAALAPAESERQADNLLWTSGDGTPTPMTRYLLHAARLRSQIRVFDDGRPSRRVRDELGLLIDALSGAAAAPEFPGPVAAAGDHLPARLEYARSAGLTLRARLDAMRRAIAIIDQNLARTLSLPVTDFAVGPLSEDRQLSAWFGQRIDDEIGLLDAALAHAQTAWDMMTGKALPPAGAQANGQSAPDLASTVAAGLPQRGAPSLEPRVVIFTALEVEYEAIQKYLAGPIRQHEERGTLYEMGELPEVRGHWQVAVTQTGPGSTTAGIQVDRAVSVFAPDVVLFLGVAGGRKDVVRGDVVAGDMTYDYEWGKSTKQEYLPRMRTHFPAFRLLQHARLVTREGRWQQRIRPTCPQPPPAAFVKPIVTGGKVVAHSLSAVALLLDRVASDALAVETEGHGFLEGAYVNPGTDALVIRGISDLLSGKTRSSDTRWQPVASSHAAAFAVELLDSLGASQP